MGAIIGRTAIAGTQSYLTGAIAVLTLVAVHRLASIVRFLPLAGKLMDHRVRVLVADGGLRRRELRRCGLTDNDVLAQLRQRGVFDLADVRYVLYETKGSITVVPRDERADGPLVRSGVDAPPGTPSSPRQRRDRPARGRVGFVRPLTAGFAAVMAFRCWPARRRPSLLGNLTAT